MHKLYLNCQINSLINQKKVLIEHFKNKEQLFQL
jgi:hypothetical protein